MLKAIHVKLEECSPEVRKNAPANAYFFRPGNGLYYTKAGYPIHPTPPEDIRHSMTAAKPTAEKVEA